MTNNYKINAAAALSKAKDAVANWEAAIIKAKTIGTSDDVAFCEKSLEACKVNLEKTMESVKNWHEWN